MMLQLVIIAATVTVIIAATVTVIIAATVTATVAAIVAVVMGLHNRLATSATKNSSPWNKPYLPSSSNGSLL